MRVMRRIIGEEEWDREMTIASEMYKEATITKHFYRKWERQCNFCRNIIPLHVKCFSMETPHRYRMVCSECMDEIKCKYAQIICDEVKTKYKQILDSFKERLNGRNTMAGNTTQ